MTKITPSLPKGTRDFGPNELKKRQHIFSTIRQVFSKYGFEPIETPVMENLSTLTGKYGDEGDRLLFKVLNSGDYLSKANKDALTNLDSGKLTSSIAEKGLRYDLTIPFARYVVQHQNDISFPFKRYQIQPVWRADRPQKGRYREFYQCDVDVIGSDSLLNEVELLLIYEEVFKELGISVTIKVNNRKILAGLAEVNGIADKLTDFTTAIDKLDKIGIGGVEQELTKRGIDTKILDQITALSDKTNNRKISLLKEQLSSSVTGTKGVEEMAEIFDFINLRSLIFDPSLARGLDYYTGTIIEVTADDVNMGSIGGGGRYDDLTGLFGLKDMSGVGISFGAERIYDVMEELDLFELSDLDFVQAMFINFGGESEKAAFRYLREIRTNGISAELYPSDAKFKKQMTYADRKGIKYAIFTGETELKENKLKVKNMLTGEENLLAIDQVIQLLKH